MASFLEEAVQIFDLDDESYLRALPPTYSATRVEGVNPAPFALEPAGAAMVPQHEFRMMDASGGPECLLVDTHFQAWQSPPRRVQREGRHGGAFGT